MKRGVSSRFSLVRDLTFDDGVLFPWLLRMETGALWIAFQIKAVDPPSERWIEQWLSQSHHSACLHRHAIVLGGIFSFLCSKAAKDAIEAFGLTFMDHLRWNTVTVQYRGLHGDSNGTLVSSV